MNRLLTLCLIVMLRIPSALQAQVKTPPGRKPPSPTYPTPAAQKSDPALEQLANDYEAAFNKADTKGIAALYTENALRVTPDGRLLAGARRSARATGRRLLAFTRARASRCTLGRLESHARSSRD